MIANRAGCSNARRGCGASRWDLKRPGSTGQAFTLGPDYEIKPLSILGVTQGGEGLRRFPVVPILAWCLGVVFSVGVRPAEEHGKRYRDHGSDRDADWASTRK